MEQVERGKKQRGAEDALCLTPIFRRGNVRLGMRLVQGHPVCHRARIITQDVRPPMAGDVDIHQTGPDV